MCCFVNKGFEALIFGLFFFDLIGNSNFVELHLNLQNMFSRCEGICAQMFVISL
jgi:hypothetical protein